MNCEMKHSEAFNELYQMSLTTEVPLVVNHRRLAIYIGLVALEEDNITKKKMLSILPRLIDREWKEISAIMLTYTNSMNTLCRRQRIQMIRALDTYREFDRI